MSIRKLILLFSAMSSLCGAAEMTKANKKGLIVYFDGLHASGKTTLAKRLLNSLMKDEYIDIPYLSTDDYAKETGEQQYMSAVRMFRKAMEEAKKGKMVFLDSFLIEEYFKQKDSKDFDMLLIGVWCSFSCLKERLDKPSKLADGWKKSKIEVDYRERYGDKSAADILKDNGSFAFSTTINVKYDLFLNTEKASADDLTRKVLELIHSVNKKK